MVGLLVHIQVFCLAWLPGIACSTHINIDSKLTVQNIGLALAINLYITVLICVLCYCTFINNVRH